MLLLLLLLKLHLSLPRGCSMIFRPESYLIIWPPFKVEIDSQAGILRELVIGKLIHNILSSLTKFHLCVGGYTSQVAWTNSSQHNSGMMLAHLLQVCHWLAEELIPRDMPPCLPVLMSLQGVGLETWSSIVHSSVSHLFLTQSNQYQDNKFSVSTYFLNKVAFLRALLSSSLSLQTCLTSEHLRMGLWHEACWDLNPALQLNCQVIAHKSLHLPTFPHP